MGLVIDSDCYNSRPSSVRSSQVWNSLSYLWLLLLAPMYTCLFITQLKTIYYDSCLSSVSLYCFLSQVSMKRFAIRTVSCSFSLILLLLLEVNTSFICALMFLWLQIVLGSLGPLAHTKQLGCHLSVADNWKGSIAFDKVCLSFLDNKSYFITKHYFSCRQKTHHGVMNNFWPFSGSLLLTNSFEKRKTNHTAGWRKRPNELLYRHD